MAGAGVTQMEDRTHVGVQFFWPSVFFGADSATAQSAIPVVICVVRRAHVADIVIPDVIPMAVDIGLALLTLLLGLWKDRRNHSRAGFSRGATK